MEYAHNGRNTFDGRARNCTLSNLLLKNEIDMICELYTRLLIRWQKRVRLNADLPCSLSRLCEVGQTRLILNIPLHLVLSFAYGSGSVCDALPCTCAIAQAHGHKLEYTCACTITQSCDTFFLRPCACSALPLKKRCQ